MGRRCAKWANRLSMLLIGWTRFAALLHQNLFLNLTFARLQGLHSFTPQTQFSHLIEAKLFPSSPIGEAITMRATALHLSILLSLLGFTSADVEFTSPAAGTTLTGGGAITITWRESGVAPPLSDLSTYSLYLCAGGNDESTIIQLAPVTTQGSFANGNTAEGSFAASLGASIPANAYFFKMVSQSTTGGTVTNYSPRFSLSDMTGVFPQNVITGMQSVTGTEGPPTQNDEGSSPSSGATGSFALPWDMQTGLTKYAAMQPYPPTKITAKTRTPLFPSSPYTVATTLMGHPTILTTVTQPVTWAFSQKENPVCCSWLLLALVSRSLLTVE